WGEAPVPAFSSVYFRPEAVVMTFFTAVCAAAGWMETTGAATAKAAARAVTVMARATARMRNSVWAADAARVIHRRGGACLGRRRFLPADGIGHCRPGA